MSIFEAIVLLIEKHIYVVIYSSFLIRRADLRAALTCLLRRFVLQGGCVRVVGAWPLPVSCCWVEGKETVQ